MKPFNHNIIVKLSWVQIQYCARYTSRILPRTLSRNRLQHQAKPLASPFCEGWWRRGESGLPTPPSSRLPIAPTLLIRHPWVWVLYKVTQTTLPSPRRHFTYTPWLRSQLIIELQPSPPFYPIIPVFSLLFTRHTYCKLLSLGGIKH